MTEIYYNDILLDLPDDEVIPITKQVSEISDLSTFLSDYSQTFRVKKTRAMLSLFENIDRVESTSVIPYRQLDVKVCIDGAEVFPKARMKVVRTDKDFIYVNVYGGAVALFSELKERKITDLDLSDLDIVWTAENAADSVIDDLDAQFLMCDFSDDGLIMEEPSGTDPLVLYERQVRPFVRVKRIFEQILTGVNLVMEFDAEDVYNELFIPITTLKASSESSGAFLSEGFTEAFYLISAIPIGETIVYNPAGNIQSGGYRASVAGRYQFFLGIPSTIPTLTIHLKVNMDDADFEVTATPDGHTFWVDLEEADFVNFTGTVGGVPELFPLIPKFTFQCQAILSDGLAVGSLINVAKQLPPIDRATFVKAICNFFGLIPDYDAFSNTLRLWGINRLLKNKPIAKDWSKYLSDEGEMEFTMDYAQRNHIKWSEIEDTSEPGVTIFVDDQTLEREKDLLILPFGGCDEVVHGGERMARIGWFKTRIDSYTYDEEESIEPRIVLGEGMSRGTLYKDSVDPYITYLITAEQNRKARALNLGLAVGYNDAIVRMLRSTKKLAKKFDLPAIEIATFDHSIPIYLEQYSAHFFAKRVNNWIEGELCNVELIRL